MDLRLDLRWNRNIVRSRAIRRTLGLPNFLFDISRARCFIVNRTHPAAGILRCLDIEVYYFLDEFETFQGEVLIISRLKGVLFLRENSCIHLYTGRSIELSSNVLN